MMSGPLHTQLSRRESQIMDIVFEMGEATAAEIMERLPDPPGNSSVRVLLSILEDKGHLTHRREGNRYIYVATMPADNAKRTALSHLLKTFFGGSARQVVAALLSSEKLTEEELDEIARLVEQAKNEESKS